MADKKVKNTKPSLSKDDFIKFLATSSPEEITNYIINKGKPPKLISPMIFLDRDDDKSNKL